MQKGATVAHRLGIDIGGTFTDANLVDEATGEVRTAKVPTTPGDPAAGFSEAARRILAEQGVDAEGVSYVMHATTVATNAIIEGKVARTGFVTTAGFRDMLEIARQIRPSLYDLHFEKPRPLVPRHLCVGVPERLGARGEVLEELDEEGVRQAADRLRREGVEAIAVCFLHGYANPEHERRAGEILRQRFPGAMVSLSSEVAPGVPRVLPGQHYRHQRLHPPGRRRVPQAHRGAPARRRGGRGAAGDAEQRRGVQLRRGQGEAGVHGGVRAGPRG